ncbi:hypothetical protein BHU72_08705 [Desulfuribacillus stibiiarsenatis]|uniref:Metallo-beta-lactamase domain-containing protein n=1 Tax=Desulfuribacillus stibiiarsenatis TaxID=1390249 RepID=A0A1E5L356_9FIRM|nr:MBL fold metallo-hydrolase [Desulfuribacillus stibiiarsenatis]OEH84575.1 hypothetical protein BHU72_08705 [Desulfuribacillus stibiiarsenatis]
MVWNIRTLPMGPVEANCYVIYDEQSKNGFIVDPGSLDIHDILEIIESEQLQIQYILLTHGHFDHILGIDELRKVINAPVCIHKDDQIKLINAKENLSTFMGSGYEFNAAERVLEDREMLPIANMNIVVYHTPGHTSGGVCYHLGNYLFSGDTLFAGSVGRTDFPGGSMDQLIDGIRKQLLVLPDDTVVYPGHNEDTTIGWEKINNPFLR